MNGFLITIRDDGAVYWHGVDTGKTKVLAMNTKKKWIALHTAGHMYTSGQSQNYGPAKINVHEYEETEHGEDTIRLVELFGDLEWSPRGNNWRR